MALKHIFRVFGWGRVKNWISGLRKT